MMRATLADKMLAFLIDTPGGVSMGDLCRVLDLEEPDMRSVIAMLEDAGWGLRQDAGMLALDPRPDPMDCTALRASLCDLGWALDHRLVTGSTNDDGLALTLDAPATLHVAESQLAGRGQHGRRWHARLGQALTFSLSLPVPAERVQVPAWLTLQAGLALREALPRQAREKVTIKWPNDLVVGRRKLAGILAQSRQRGARARLVLGVGINVAAAPALAGRQTTCVEALAGAVAREPLLLELVRALDAVLRHPLPPERVRADWSAQVDALRDRPVRSAAGLSGVGQGLAADGGYRLAGGDGACIVPPGDTIVEW